MARAILKRSKVLLMDEVRNVAVQCFVTRMVLTSFSQATASVDYATDELIGKTIRQSVTFFDPTLGGAHQNSYSEFAESTILTIAHRLRTVIDYNRVMLLEDGKIVEFDTPGTLLANRDSKFYALCKATGKEEFSTLRKLAGVTSITGETATTSA